MIDNSFITLNRQSVASGIFTRGGKLFLGFTAFFAAVIPSGAYDYQVSDQPVIPLRGLVYTPQDVVTLHKLVKEGGVPAAVADGFLKRSNGWMDRSDDEIAALIPNASAVYAYGFSGDPKNDASWPRLGADGVCSLDRPGEVRSPVTGDVYGTQAKGMDYYDPGDGWVRKSDGKRFFFKGIWNSYIDKELHDGVANLAIAYIVTGDPNVAKRALFILDRLAALRAARPQDLGPSDWPHQRVPGKGTLGVMGNHANSLMMRMALALDLVANAPHAKAPSVTSGLTVLENIRKNYFSLFETWYFDRKELTNHGSVLLANAVAQGMLFGDEKKLKMGIDGVSAFFNNTINRDGDYVEVSGNYGNLGRVYISTPTLMLTHYDPKNYPEKHGLPSPDNYPFSLKFGDDRRWYQMAAGILFDLPVMGRYPQYGDMDADWRVLEETDQGVAKARGTYLRLLYYQTTREDWKKEIAERYWSLPETGRRSGHQFLLGLSQWLEPERPLEKGASGAPPSEKSLLMGGKGIAFLRSGEGKQRRALFMRGGINSYHGHDDQMAVVPYGHKMMLAGEYGYNLAGTPDHYGWGMRSISHLTAVVDEDLPATLSYKGDRLDRTAPAASVTGYLDIEPAQFVEMRNPRLWSNNIEDYRRTVWLVDIDPENYYFVDFFRIVGGSVHDYAWNAPFPKKRSGDDFKVEGVSPKQAEGVWTLASLNGKHCSEPWNQSGKSWGERLDGMAGHVQPLPGEPRLPTSDWNPDPGNGYGMIWNVKSEETKSDWQASWRLQDGKHLLRARLLNFDGMTAITANSPSLWLGKPFDMAIARRIRKDSKAPLESRFVNIVEVGSPGAWPIRNAARIALKGSSKDASKAAGIKVSLFDGRSDLIIASPIQQELQCGEVRTDARNTFVRLDREGAATVISFQEGTLLEAGGWKIGADVPVLKGTVTSVEADDYTSKLTLSPPLPEGGALEGATLLIEGSPNAVVPRLHNEYYSIEKVAFDEARGESRLVFSRQSLIGTTWSIADQKADSSQLTLEWRNVVAGPPGTLAFQGCGVFAGAVAQGEPLGVIKQIRNREVNLHVHDPSHEHSGVKKERLMRVLLASPGERFSIPTTVVLRKIAEESWLLRSTGPLQLRIQKKPGALLSCKKGASWQKLAEADSDGIIECRISPEEMEKAGILLRFETLETRGEGESEAVSTKTPEAKAGK